MANPEHLEILKQGVEAWNKWRRGNPILIPDLRGAHLYEASLPKAYLVMADLRAAYLTGANLRAADLTGANLTKVELCGANLTGANLSGIQLAGANLSRAIASWTIFADIDLSAVKGLETVEHLNPSSIGVDTIYRSQGKIPEVFLRGCGVPEYFIAYMRSPTVQPSQFYKSFISYSSKDQKLASRLYKDLQNKGVRCWLASEDLKIGDRIRVGIDEAIRLHDKLLLVLSKHSVASDWVEQEVETALERERKEKRTVLFPVRLDDTVMKVDTGWPSLIKNTRNIGDFSKWRNPEAYQNAFNRLLHDLKAEERLTAKVKTETASKAGKKRGNR